MTRERQNFRARLGTTWGFDVKIRDGSGTPFTPATAVWHMWDRTGTALLNLNVGNGVRIEAVNGEVLAHVDVPPAMQATLRPGVYEHALRVTTPQGATDDQIGGLVTVEDVKSFT